MEQESTSTRKRAVDQVTRNVIKTIQQSEKKETKPIEKRPPPVELPKENEEVSEFLKNYKAEIDVKSIKDMLKIKKIPENKNDFGILCEQMYNITKVAIASGYSVEGKSEKWVITKLTNLRKMLWTYVVTNYDKICSYDLPQLSSHSNTPSIVFILNAHLLVILDVTKSFAANTSPNRQIGPSTDKNNEIDTRELVRLELLVYPKKQINDLSMIELQNTLHALAIKWFSISYSETIRLYVENLERRAAYLVVGRNDKTCMDGKDIRDKIATINVGTSKDGKDQIQQVKYSCSTEYISDIATILTRMKQSIHYIEKYAEFMVDVLNIEKWEGT